MFYRDIIGEIVLFVAPIDLLSFQLVSMDFRFAVRDMIERNPYKRCMYAFILSASKAIGWSVHEILRHVNLKKYTSRGEEIFYHEGSLGMMGYIWYTQICVCKYRIWGKEYTTFMTGYHELTKTIFDPHNKLTGRWYYNYALFDKKTSTRYMFREYHSYYVQENVVAHVDDISLMGCFDPSQAENIQQLIILRDRSDGIICVHRNNKPFNSVYGVCEILHFSEQMIEFKR